MINPEFVGFLRKLRNCLLISGKNFTLVTRVNHDEDLQYHGREKQRKIIPTTTKKKEQKQRAIETPK